MIRCLTVLVAASLIAGCGRSPMNAPESKGRPGAVANGPGTQDVGTTANSQGDGAEKVVLGAAELLAGISGNGPLTIKEIQGWLDDPANHRPFDVELPMWLKPGAGQVKDLKENPMTRAKIELGRQLFFDKRLSADNSVSCASCHQADKGFTIGTPMATGVQGQTRRNPPALLNRVSLALGHDQQFWDGSCTSVEDALLHSLENPTQMAASPDATIEKLQQIEGYRLQFDEIYKGVTWASIGDAVGCFVRCLVTGPSTFDYFDRWQIYKDFDQLFLDEDPELARSYQEARLAAEAHPMSESAKRGEYLFFGNKAWCSACHNGVNFTDELYHNTGVGVDADNPDLGRIVVTRKAEDWGAFRTPTIRGAVFTAPYMHDGSVATLEGVIDWYDHQGRANRNLDYRYKRIAGEELTEQDKRDLVEFVKACSGPLPVVETGRLPE